MTIQSTLVERSTRHTCKREWIPISSSLSTTRRLHGLYRFLFTIACTLHHAIIDVFGYCTLRYHACTTTRYEHATSTLRFAACAGETSSKCMHKCCRSPTTSHLISENATGPSSWLRSAIPSSCADVDVHTLLGYRGR